MTDIATGHQRPVDDTTQERPFDPILGRRTTRRDVLLAVLVAAAVMAFAIWWRSPPVPTDPWHYLRSAREFPSGAWAPLGYTRYGLIFASMVPAVLFGHSEAAYYMVPVLSAGLLAASLYLLARRWWGPVAGVVAVVVCFGNSVMLYNLTRGYPDIPSTALIMAAVLTALLAKDHDFRGAGGVGWLLVTGFLLGWGIEVRETCLFGIPFVVAAMWRRGAMKRALGFMALPILGWLAVDVIVSWWAYGEPLLKILTLLHLENDAPTTVPPGSSTPASAEPVAPPTRWDIFLSIPRKVLEQPDGVWLVVVGVIAVLALFARNRPLRLAAFGFVSVYVLNLFAGGIIWPSRPFGNLLVLRYWIQYFPSMALVVAGLSAVVTTALVRLFRGSASFAWRPLIASVVAAVAIAVPVVGSAQYLPTAPAFAPNGGNALEELRGHLAGRGDLGGRVWTDWETRRILPAFMRPTFGGDRVWSAPTKSLTGEGEPAAGDFVLYYSPKDNTCDHCKTALAPALRERPTPPDNWELEFATPTRNLLFYRVH